MKISGYFYDQNPSEDRWVVIYKGRSPIKILRAILTSRRVYHGTSLEWNET